MHFPGGLLSASGSLIIFLGSPIILPRESYYFLGAAKSFSPTFGTRGTRNSLEQFSRPEFTNLSVLAVLFLGSLVVRRARRVAFRKYYERPNFVNDHRRLQVNRLTQRFFRGKARFRGDLCQPSSSNDVVRKDKGRRAIFRRRVRCLRYHVRVLVQALPLQYVPLQLALARYDRRRNGAERRRSITRRGNAQEVVVFHRCLARVHSRALHVLFPLFLNRGRLNEQSKRGSGRARRLLTRPFRVDTRVRPNLTKVYQLVLPINLSRVRDRATMRSVLRQEGGFVRLNKDAQDTWYRVEIARGGGPIVHLRVEERLLILKNNARRVVVFSVLLIRNEACRIRLKNVRRRTSHSAHLRDRCRLTF